jgi:CRP-like cAMP-binding protein
VLTGYVKLTCTAINGTQSMIRVVPPEGFFGESVLVPQVEPLREIATTLAPTQLMSWSADEIESYVERQPRLALGLCEYFGRFNTILRDRIVTAATQNAGNSVKMALVGLAHEIGDPQTDGARRIVGLTHQALAEYIGTSREIVTCEMNRLRTLGYLQYCRRYIDVYMDALAEVLTRTGLNAMTRSTAISGLHAKISSV